MTRSLAIAALLLVATLSTTRVEGFSSQTPPKVVDTTSRADWIAETFQQPVDTVVQGPKHVLMYDTTLRGK